MPSHHYFSMDVGWKALLRDFGIRHDQVLRRAGLPADLLTRQVQVNSADYFRFWRGMEEEVGDPMFALEGVQNFV